MVFKSVSASVFGTIPSTILPFSQTLEAALEEPTGEKKKRGRKPGTKNKDVRAINEADSSTTPIVKRVSQRRRN
jgi:hypothetical protein